MEVEVVFPRVCGAFYQAFLQDLDIDKGSALLAFPSDWKPSVWVELAHIRLTQESANVSSMSFQAGKKVEALLPHHDNEPPGWWTGTLLKSRGDLHVVEFQSGAEKYQDIVENDKLRTPNSNLPLSKISLYKKDFSVPDDLGDYCQRRGVHENFRSKINAICVSYGAKHNALVVMACGESCLHKAELLIEMHFKDLRVQKSLLGVNETGQRSYNHHGIEPRVKEIRFHIPEDLVGMAIGREGANVNEARRILGVKSVEFDDYSSMFSVKGEDEEALLKAKERLEFGREIMFVPKTLAGKMIGKNGSVIQEILDKSKIHNVRVVGDDEAKQRGIDVTNQIQFDFIGRKAEIDNAKMMMEYHLEHLKSVEKILQSRKEQQWSPASSGSGGTFFPQPASTRGYRRGLGRGGRGGYQGGGGGGRGHRQRERDLPEDRTEHERRDGRFEEEDEELLPSFRVSNSAPAQSEETYQSDDNSDSNDEERGVASDDQKSPPEDDEQGPDRRRQPNKPRGAGRSGRGGAGYRHSYNNRRSRGGSGGGGGGGGAGSGAGSGGGGGGSSSGDYRPQGRGGRSRGDDGRRRVEEGRGRALDDDNMRGGGKSGQGPRGEGRGAEGGNVGGGDQGRSGTRDEARGGGRGGGDGGPRQGGPRHQQGEGERESRSSPERMRATASGPKPQRQGRGRQRAQRQRDSRPQQQQQQPAQQTPPSSTTENGAGGGGGGGSSSTTAS